MKYRFTIITDQPGQELRVDYMLKKGETARMIAESMVEKGFGDEKANTLYSPRVIRQVTWVAV